MIKASGVVLAVAGMALGCAIAVTLRPSAPALPPVSSVDAAWLEQLRPERRGGLWDRVRMTPIAPVATQTAPPTAEGRRRVQAYCAPAVVPVLIGPSIELDDAQGGGARFVGATSNSAGGEVGRPPSILPDFRARSGRHRLELYSTLSDGSGWRREYRPPSQRWRLATDADSTWLVTERWLPRAARSAARCAIAGAAGALAGLLVDRPEGAAILACGATFLPH